MNQAITRINSHTDARTVVENSGVVDWAWDERSSLEGFIDFIWSNYDQVNNDLRRELIRYLQSRDEDPSVFGIN